MRGSDVYTPIYALGASCVTSQLLNPQDIFLGFMSCVEFINEVLHLGFERKTSHRRNISLTYLRNHGY